MTTVKLSDIEAYADPDCIRTDYSGRAMYGRECLGIVVDSLSEFVNFVVCIVREATEYETETGEETSLSDFACDIHNVSVDNMGLSTIYYWPSVQVEVD